MSSFTSTSIIYLGLDVHKDSVTIAVLPEGAAAPTRIDRYPNDFAKLRRVFARHAKDGEVRACSGNTTSTMPVNSRGCIARASSR